MSSASDHLRTRARNPLVLAGLVLAIGLVVSAAASKQAHSLIESEAKLRFRSLQDILVNDLTRRFTLPRYGLMGARGAFAASNSLTRNEFSAYVKSRDLEHEFPGILGIGMIKKVSRIDLDAFTAAERADNCPDFSVATTGNDPLCYVITSVFPKAPNRAAWGLDVGSEAVRRAGVEQAIASGEATLTGVITLVQDAQKTPGYLLLVPVFNPNYPITTAAERHAALQAIVYAPIRAHQLLDNLQLAGAELVMPRVFDGDPQHGGQRIFPSQDAPSSTTPRFLNTIKLPLFGRDLYLELSSTPRMHAAFSEREPLVTAIGGSVLSLIAALLVLSLGRGHSRALKVAHAMTRDLREAKITAENALREANVYRATLDQHAIVSMTDGTGRIISVNDAFCAISGYTREELLGQDHRMINSGTHGKEFWRAMWSTILSGKPWRQVVCNRAKNGSHYWVDSLITPFTGADGKIDRLVSIRFDVTEQKRLEQALLAAQDRLSLALEAGGVGIWEFDPVTNALVWDEQMFRLYGTKRENFPGAYQAWESAVHRDDLARSVRELTAALAGESGFDTQFRIVWPDGSVHHIRALAVVKRDADGKPIRMTGTNWDITEDKERDDERRLLTAILEQTPDYIGVSDLQGRLLYHNPAARAMLGLPSDFDLSSFEIKDRHPAWASKKVLEEGMPAVFERGVWTGETALKHQDGSEIPVSQVLLLHRNDQGEPVRLSTIIRDLRSQKAAEVRLQAISAMQQGILDSANLSIIATDPTGIVTHWNATATRMLQWTAEEMIGKQTTAVIHALDEVAQRAVVLTKELGVSVAPGFDAFVIKARTTPVADEQEWTYVRKDGSRFPVLLSVTALWDAQGAVIGYLGIAADITERRRHEQEIRQAMEAATAGARAKADFLAVMSHEIRTPMNGMIGMTNLLVKTTLDPQQREYVETVRTCGESLLTLINDILDFSKLKPDASNWKPSRSPQLA
jgi:PAS domain S-box-containing protein